MLIIHNNNGNDNKNTRIYFNMVNTYNTLGKTLEESRN